MTDEIGRFGMGKQRGPYGTNEGDMWLAPGSDMQNMLDREQPGVVLIHEIINGEDSIYTTRDEEMIAEARKGHEMYIAEEARRN